MPTRADLLPLLSARFAATLEQVHVLRALIYSEMLSPSAQSPLTSQALDGTVNVTIRDGVARVPVRGLLLPRVPWLMRFGWGTSCEQLAHEFMEAVTSPRVRAVVLDVSSGGGDVEGLQEMSELVYKARDVKPIISYVSGAACSGGFWISSAASRRVTSETGLLGSVGAMAEFMDWSGWEEKAGIKTITIVSSQSPRKHIDPATPAGHAEVLEVLDRMADVFINTVARNVGVTREKVLADFGQGGVFVGAAAVEAGLADEVMTYEALHADLVARHGIGGPRFLFPARAATTTLTQGTTAMPDSDPISITVETVKAHAPLVAEALTAQGRTEGAAVERARLAGIEALAQPGLEEVIAAAKADPACSAADAALRILAHEKALRAQGLKQLAGDEGGSGKAKAGLTPGDEPTGDSAVAARVLATHRRLNP